MLRFNLLLAGAVLTFTVLTGTAAAHTEVTHMVPAASSSVAAPKTVTLDLSEPVNLRFSTFKVYALPAGSDAAALSKAKLNLKYDSAERADLFPGASGLAARVQIPLRAGLKPGAYVVMWHLLSDDGHPVSGQSVFRIK
ncbi:copper resistance protein CopC [Deinococcus sp.]|uniref:copper resistance CopC family protein n=1 Tax=Deinococcus sp. TaxID=47478 RepID=UPI0025DC1426|nr:copper resistance protein CopC [Deinococcus sp.]